MMWSCQSCSVIFDNESIHSHLLRNHFTDNQNNRQLNDIFDCNDCRFSGSSFDGIARHMMDTGHAPQLSTAEKERSRVDFGSHFNALFQKLVKEIIMKTAANKKVNRPTTNSYLSRDSIPENSSLTVDNDVQTIRNRCSEESDIRVIERGSNRTRLKGSLLEDTSSHSPVKSTLSDQPISIDFKHEEIRNMYGSEHCKRTQQTQFMEEARGSSVYDGSSAKILLRKCSEDGVSPTTTTTKLTSTPKLCRTNKLAPSPIVTEQVFDTEVAKDSSQIERMMFECYFCVKSFRMPSQLKAHERSHTKEKPFKCSFCDKSFGQAGDMRRHQRLHTGEKPYRCQYCGKSFPANSGLSSHIKFHHIAEHKDKRGRKLNESDVSDKNKRMNFDIAL